VARNEPIDAAGDGLILWPTEWPIEFAADKTATIVATNTDKLAGVDSQRIVEASSRLWLFDSHLARMPPANRSSRNIAMNCLTRIRPAFSLMELLCVVVILGLIATLALPRVFSGTDTAKEKACYHNRAEINITAEQYYIHTGNWPATDLSDIGADPNYFPNGVPTCPVSGAPYRIDGTTHRVIGHTNSAAHSP
jgi:prepilin-type N-terminal cleavage/methylation domain-containing protein